MASENPVNLWKKRIYIEKKWENIHHCTDGGYTWLVGLRVIHNFYTNKDGAEKMTSTNSKLRLHGKFKGIKGFKELSSNRVERVTVLKWTKRLGQVWKVSGRADGSTFLDVILCSHHPLLSWVLSCAFLKYCVCMCVCTCVCCKYFVLKSKLYCMPEPCLHCIYYSSNQRACTVLSTR